MGYREKQKGKARRHRKISTRGLCSAEYLGKNIGMLKYVTNANQFI